MKELLLAAKEEILSLRRQNEILDAKVGVMELFACVLHTQPARQGGGMSPDIAWELDKKIRELDAPEGKTVVEGTAG